MQILDDGAMRIGPGRPRKVAKSAAPGNDGDGLAAILSAVQGSEHDRVRMRSALEKIQAVVADALA